MKDIGINEELVKEIYERLGDEVSKTIFSNRLLYSLTGDIDYIRQMLKKIPEARKFYDLMEQTKDEKVIFGVGSWGKELYGIMKNYSWKCFIDNNPSVSEFESLPVVAYSDFINHYQNEIIVISSRLYNKDMYQQLIESGIKSNKIINVGNILDEWSRRQYFDLDELNPQEEEVFVDAGGFDGITSVEFSNWCSKSKHKFVYVFEPDKKNIEKCCENLKIQKMKYEIIPKGCWNEEITLHFRAQGNGDSAIDVKGDETIEVTSLDRELSGKKVTFIKMDIEGSELKALYGAKEIITRNRPRLAICIYHKVEDVWAIPRIIMQYYSGYKFYIRHYSLTVSETVLYALP